MPGVSCAWVSTVLTSNHTFGAGGSTNDGIAGQVTVGVKGGGSYVGVGMEAFEFGDEMTETRYVQRHNIQHGYPDQGSAIQHTTWIP